MTRVEIELSPSVHEKASSLAKRDDVSVEQLIADVVSRNMVALEQIEYLKARARRANRADLRRILAKVPDVPPVPGDELPADFKLRRKSRDKGGEHRK